MPGGDRTGPVGYGPLTGRGSGFCAGYGVPGFRNPPPLYGRGGRRGFFRGAEAPPQWNPSVVQYSPPPTQGEEAYLQDEIQYLKAHLQKMERRLGELKQED